MGAVCVHRLGWLSLNHTKMLKLTLFINLSPMIITEVV